MKNFYPSLLDTKSINPTLNLPPFTVREVDVIACLIHRRSSKKIGALLSLSSKTVSNHICNIMSKIGCTSREGILDYVERMGHIPLLRQHYAHLNPTAFTEEQEIIKTLPNSIPPLAKKNKIFWAIGLSVFLLLIGGGVFFSLQLSPIKSKEFIARSDLILPSETIILNRPELMSKMEEKMKEKEGIQTIALVGIGGVGKTTLARQYARQQIASIVWEINAETSESLRFSFETLAQTLAKTEEDQKEVRALQEIKDLEERDGKVILFVRNHLRAYPNWFLFYDNVEKFSDIRKYFPQDFKTWGQGKIILTTRDGNIQNNKSVNHVIQVGELNAQQKFDLFSKIIKSANDYSITKFENEKIKKFLEEIPPFPLDVSIAANYLKTTDVSFEKYTENIRKISDDFINIQKSILNESGEYQKTRYGIVTLSLRNLINEHSDFKNLLLFISLLDSQNIPKDLLIQYKGESIVADFIYNLKRYSLITNESDFLSVPNATFSIHRSTQAIMLDHFIKTLHLKDSQFLQDISNNLIYYIKSIINSGNTSKINIMVDHCEKFLSHNDSLNDLIKGSVSGELGYMYYLLAKPKKAKQSIERCIKNLNRSPNKTPYLYARPLAYLGIIHWEEGDLNKAQDLLEQSLKFHRKSSYEDPQGLFLALVYLGIVFGDQGLLENAIQIFEQSLLVYKNYLHKKHFDLKLGFAFSLTHLGSTYKRIGNLEKAINLMEQSINIYREHNSENAVDAGWALANLGDAYLLIGCAEKGKDLIEKAFHIYIKNFPEESQDVAWILWHLGEAYEKVGDYARSIKFLEKSIDTFRSALGEDNIKIYWAFLTLADTYIKLENYNKAQNILEKMLPVYEKYYGKDNMYVARPYRRLGKIYLLKNNIEKSEGYIKTAFFITQKNKNGFINIDLELLADLYTEKAKRAMIENNKNQFLSFNKQAKSYLEKSLKITMENFPKDSPYIVRLQSKLSNLEKGEPYKGETNVALKILNFFCARFLKRNLSRIKALVFEYENLKPTSMKVRL